MCETITTFGDTKTLPQISFQDCQESVSDILPNYFSKRRKRKKMILLKGRRILINNTGYNIKQNTATLLN